MKTRTYFLAGTLIVGAALAATIAAYPHLPDSVPTHWDIHGEANGYSPKWALFLVPGPAIIAAIMVLNLLLPWLSPERFKVDSFRSTYLQIMLMTAAFLAYIHGITLWVGIGHSVSIPRVTVVGMCLLWVLMGNVMGKIRRNFYIGIKTPWALANERVWNATHRFAAKTWVVGGLAGLALVAAGQSFWAPFAALMTGALVPVVYSLYFYKQLERRGEL